MKVNSKCWFDNQIMSAIQRQDKLKFKYSGLETDKDDFKVAKVHLILKKKKLILKKKK